MKNRMKGMEQGGSEKELRENVTSGREKPFVQVPLRVKSSMALERKKVKKLATLRRHLSETSLKCLLLSAFIFSLLSEMLEKDIELHYDKKFQFRL
ncbi:hypothetical protein AVEN_180289-1 [Araneus ventricosus]|uniref:Uncharacterized protein n=1 Tax=Araneus ventricosus TaxID=182803 RepID=A0A4Y2HZF3_ARAVE|nr:hypothetical protein AVEN_180289-1 [Araneus ventricosus]